MYLTLSVIDLVACPYIALPVAVGIWRPKDCSTNCTEPYYDIRRQTNSILCATYSTLYYPFYAWPLMITAFFTTARFFQIKYPLRYISRRIVLGCMWVFLMIFGVLTIIAMYIAIRFRENNLYFFTLVQKCYVQDMEVALVLWVVGGFLLCTIQLTGIAFTILTVGKLYQLYKDRTLERGEEKSLRGTVKILCLNCVSFTTLLFFLISYFFGLSPESQFQYKMLIKFFIRVIFPAFSSLLNPLIYLSFTARKRRVVAPIM